MQLPKELTTVTPFSKGLALSMFIFIPFIAFLIGMSSEQRFETVQVEKLQQKLQDETKKRSDLQEQFDLSLQNRGKFISSTTTKYAPRIFGVYSPLFNDKKIQITKYKYKNADITNMKIQLDSEITVEVWQSSNYDSEAVFEGYENYSLYATPISTLKEGWKDTYKGPHDIWHWRNISGGMGNETTAISLETIRDYSENQGRVFIRLTKNLVPASANFPQQTVISSKEELKNIADTIPYHL